MFALLSTVLLAWCSTLTPQPAQMVTIEKVVECKLESGIKVCQVILSGGKTGKVEAYRAAPGQPVREDMIH